MLKVLRRIMARALLAVALLSPLPALAQSADGALLAEVDPFVGAEGGGNTVPGAGVPFGLVSASPDTTGGFTSGYDSHGRIIGFSALHVSGTGGASKYGNFRVTPAIGDDALGNWAFPRSEEQASPGYYSVVVGQPARAVRAELTATRRVAVQRYTFPATDDARLMLDVSSSVPLMGGGPRATDAEVTVNPDGTVSGRATFTGGFGAGGYTLYFHAAFDRVPTATGRWEAARGRMTLIPGAGQSRGADQRQRVENRLGAYAVFDAREQRSVTLRLAVSWVSIEQARRTLAEETAGRDFDQTLAAARAEWTGVLDRIRVEGGTEAQRRIFRTALYRLHTMPHDASGENVWWASDEPHYEDFYCLWDTFRTVHPLLTLIEPQRQRDMVRSLIDTQVHDGWLPDCRIAGSTGPTQGGSNADVVLADAIVKNLGGFDREAAWRAMMKNADVQSDDPMNHGRELRDYLALGYMSLDHDRSASRTLEYAYDDYVISLAGDALGHREDARRLRARSTAWRNLWDGDLGCIRPRYADGRWLENFDCAHDYPDQTAPWWDHPFYEGTSRQYSTYVPHDVGGLTERLGGPQGLVDWLDAFFAEGAYSHNNEPDILAPWLYIHAGRQDRTAQLTRGIMANSYRIDRAGIPGNDDSGTLSAWYVWAAVGLFPNAGQPIYYIGSPIFPRSELRLEGERTFVIAAPGVSEANLYVQRAELNGRPLDRAWLTHDEVARGGRLTLHMGASPVSWDKRPPEIGLRP